MTVEAISRPPARLKTTSVVTNRVVFLEILPKALSSVFKWGFQWGSKSNTKWLAKASGKDRAGLPILAAIAAPTTVCGNSSTSKRNDILEGGLMSNLFGFVFGALAIFTFAFILWRKLKEDYPSETIFKFTLSILAGVGLGAWVASLWLPHFVFWASFSGGLIGGSLYLGKLNLRFFEIIDGLALATSWFLLILYIGQVAKILPGLNYFILTKTLLVFLIILLYGYFLKSYRKFSWYPSGKVGFAGLLTLLLFFLSRAVLALVKQIIEPQVLLQYSVLALSVEVVNVILSLTLFVILVKLIWQRKS